MGRREEAAIEPDGPQARGYSDPLFAGFATGLVFASKYPVAAVGVVLLTSIVSLSLSWGRRLQLIVLAGLGIVCGIFVGEPMLFIKPGAVWRDVVENVRAYSSIPSAQGYWAQAISMSELGWPLLLIGAAGIVLMLRGRNTRIIGTSWILFGALLAVLYANSSFRPFRTFLSLVPLVCIAGAIAVSWMIDWAGKDANHRGLRIWIPILLIAGIAGALGYSSFRQVAGRMAHRDSRLRAIDWLCDHTEKGDKVLAIRELAFLPSEWHRVKTDGAIPSLSDLDALEQTPFDYVVTSEFDLRHATEPAVWSGYIERLKRLTADFEVAAEFGRVPAAVVPFVWRTNDERIIILRRRPRADG